MNDADIQACLMGIIVAGMGVLGAIAYVSQSSVWLDIAVLNVALLGMPFLIVVGIVGVALYTVYGWIASLYVRLR